jgi:hypothetical protein
VTVRVFLKQAVVPGFELPAQHQVQFEVQVRPRLIQAFAGVSHHAKLIALLDALPNVDLN